jgi:uncharacterized membrane protein YraQ (UPF0718 family)/copper chaperone CopZ
MFQNYIIEFFRELLVLVTEMAPYLLLGFLFAGILHVFFPAGLVKRHMGGADLLSSVKASLLGVPLPLCSCGVLPTGISFYRSGASKGSTVSFLISTPQTGVDSIIATYAMLGWPFAIIRPIVALFSGIFGGVLTNSLGTSDKDPERMNEENGYRGNRSVKEMFRYGFVEMIQDISKWLVIGLLIAALLAVVIPDDFFTATVSNEYLSMLLILFASIPLYVCATGSIPIAAVLLMKGLSPGAALVFLMAGPATNAATMAVINNSLGKRTFWLYLISIIGGAFLFGTLINELLPRDLIMGALPDLGVHTDHEHMSGWFKIASGVLLAGLLLNGWIQKLLAKKRNSRKHEEHNTNISMKIYTVEGMTCNHCKATVEKGIRELSPKGEVIADPDKDQLIITDEDIKEGDIQKVIEELGYTFKGIRR